VSPTSISPLAHISDPSPPVERTRPAPAIALTYDGSDPSYVECVVPLVDFLEVTPDSIAVAGDGGAAIPARTLAVLKDLSVDVDLVIHGVGLSIGSADGWSEQYLRLLDQLVECVGVMWHSEHLGYVNVDGQHLGTMLPLPRTEEALDLICERVEVLRVRYQLPFLLENIVRLLPEPHGEYSDAAFLNALTERSGCGLLLDVYNLECDAQNNGFGINAFLSELRIEHVRELHVACGVEHAGLLLDVHSRPLRDSTLALAREIVDRPRAGVRLVTYELLAEAVPVLGSDVIAGELRRLRAAFTQ
jgi:uncharacterized protein (UPF0276 family)